MLSRMPQPPATLLFGLEQDIQINCDIAISNLRRPLTNQCGAKFIASDLIKGLRFIF